jgi:hypothetical protein
MTKGVVYVAYGEGAVREARASCASLRRRCQYPVAAVSDSRLVGFRHVTCEHKPPVPLAKLNLDTLSPFDATVYVDADTRIGADIGALFDVVEDGWDMAMAYSGRQDGDLMGHIVEAERKATVGAIGCDNILGLQAGVFAFARNERTAALFAAWREEWERFRAHDQAALLRALYRSPARVWLLGSPWNSYGGAVVDHHFGRARR